MKRFNPALYALAVLVGLFVASFMFTARAAPLSTTFVSPIVPPVDLGGIESWLGGLGVLSFVTIVVEILKRVGVIKDGTAAAWSTVGNVVLFFILFILGVFGIDVSGDAAKDAYAILIQFGTLVLMIFGSPAAYKLARALGIVKPLAGRIKLA